MKRKLLLSEPSIKAIFIASNKTLTYQLKTPNKIKMKATNPSTNWGTFFFSIYGIARFLGPVSLSLSPSTCRQQTEQPSKNYFILFILHLFHSNLYANPDLEALMAFKAASDTTRNSISNHWSGLSNLTTLNLLFFSGNSFSSQQSHRSKRHGDK